MEVAQVGKTNGYDVTIISNEMDVWFPNNDEYQHSFASYVDSKNNKGLQSIVDFCDLIEEKIL